MRILRHHSILRCIYALLIALPMFSVLGRVIYTQSNKNAKDSYQGNAVTTYSITNEFETNEVSTQSDLIVGNIYKYTIQEQPISSYNGLRTSYFRFNLNNGYAISQYGYQLLNCDKPKNRFKSIAIETPTSEVTNYDNTVTTIYFEDITFPYSFYFVYETSNSLGSISNISKSDYLGQETLQLGETTTLDNAFDYSLSRFVDENHWGKINFFDWFTSLFVDINYNNNALYLHFINWYMNYAMLVSCAYILFLVLMWFINFSRRLLERGMIYDW